MSLDDIPTAAQLRDSLRQRIATLERERDEARVAYCEAKVERDEARAAYCALRDAVQKIYVAGNCETHSEDDWWWCDSLAGINGKEGALGVHPDKPEWRKGVDT